MKSSSGLSVFWLAFVDRGDAHGCLVLLRRGPLPAVFPLRRTQKTGGKHTNPYMHTHTHTHWGSLRCVCVCEHLFWIRYLAPSRWAGGGSRLPLRTVACLDAGRVPITATWSDEEEEKKTPLEHHSPVNILLIILAHKHTQQEGTWICLHWLNIPDSSFLVLVWNLNPLLVKLDPLTAVIPHSRYNQGNYSNTQVFHAAHHCTCNNQWQNVEYIFP